MAGGGSIGERQLVAVREKTRLLEDRASRADRIRRGKRRGIRKGPPVASCRLLEAGDLERSALDTAYLDLLDHFAVPHVAVRLWNVAERNAETQRGVRGGRTEIRQGVAVGKMSAPYCGNHAVLKATPGSARPRLHLRSLRAVPLRMGEQCLGVLALASRTPSVLPRNGHALPPAHRRAPRQRDAAPPDVPSVRPPASALARYLDSLRHERRLAAHTLAAYSRDGALLEALSAGRKPGELGTADLRHFVAALHGRGLSPRSLARLLSSWRGYFDWLVRHGEIEANPCKGIRPPRAARTLPEALSPDEATRLVSVDDARTRASGTAPVRARLFVRSAGFPN